MTDDSDTLLMLSFGIPLFSARGLTQQFGIINQASDLRRTINGELIDFSLPQFHKYSTKLTCTDQQPPAIDGIFPGQQVTVYCCGELAYPTGTTPQREAVPDSTRVDGHFTFYRPILEMRVTLVQSQFDEWSADYQWEIDLEEI